jgi:hypothetical protein
MTRVLSLYVAFSLEALAQTPQYVISTIAVQQPGARRELTVWREA